MVRERERLVVLRLFCDSCRNRFFFKLMNVPWLKFVTIVKVICCFPRAKTKFLRSGIPSTANVLVHTLDIMERSGRSMSTGTPRHSSRPQPTVPCVCGMFRRAANDLAIKSTHHAVSVPLLTMATWSSTPMTMWWANRVKSTWAIFDWDVCRYLKDPHPL